MSMSHPRLCCYSNMLVCFHSETGTCVRWIHSRNWLDIFKSFNFFLSKCQSKPMKINLTKKPGKIRSGALLPADKTTKMLKALCPEPKLSQALEQREPLGCRLGYQPALFALMSAPHQGTWSYVCPVCLSIFWPDPLPLCSRLSCWSPGSGIFETDLTNKDWS